MFNVMSDTLLTVIARLIHPDFVFLLGIALYISNGIGMTSGCPDAAFIDGGKQLPLNSKASTISHSF
jgi:uncharacterized membrane protein